MNLRFGKEWKEDILSLSKDEMFILFKGVCIQLVITEKDLANTQKFLAILEKEFTQEELEILEEKLKKNQK